MKRQIPTMNFDSAPRFPGAKWRKAGQAAWLMTCALLCMTGISGCAKDRSLDDWNRDQIRLDLGKLQAAAGTYRGYVYSNATHQSLGELELSLTAGLRTSPGSGGTKASGQPVLMGNLMLRGSRRMTLQVQDSYFDPETGTYRTNIPILEQGGRTIEISLTGHISNGTFEGTIQAGPYENHGGFFSLQKEGQGYPSDSQGEDSGAISTNPGENTGSAVVLGTYQGNTQFNSGAARAVYLVILSPNQSSQEDFLNLFVPVKTVQVTLNYGESLQILHQNAEWDQQTGTLRGRASLTLDGKTVNLALDCRQTQNDGRTGWNCGNFANNSGLVATTQVTLTTDTSGHHPVFPVSPGDTQPVLTQFQGLAKFLDGTSVPVLMSALHPAQSREEELIKLFYPAAETTLQVTLAFTFPDTDPISIYFDKTQWDSRSHKLNGRYQSSSGTSPGGSPIGTPPPAGSFDITLSCDHFQFVKTKSTFGCSYFSSRQGYVQIEFQPPAETGAFGTRRDSL